MNLELFIKELQDHLAPRLDTYELTIYLYIFRHSKLVGNDEFIIEFRTASKDMAKEICKADSPIADTRMRKTLRSLESKGCIDILSSERSSARVHLNLPHEIPGIVMEENNNKSSSLEEMDFLDVPENRRFILERFRKIV